jgi:hypothetical protein
MLDNRVSKAREIFVLMSGKLSIVGFINKNKENTHELSTL